MSDTNEFGIYEVGETIRGPLGRATYEPDFAPTRPWKIVVNGTVVNRVATKAQAQERVFHAAERKACS